MQVTIEDLGLDRECCTGYRLGNLQIGTAMFHVEAIEIEPVRQPLVGWIKQPMVAIDPKLQGRIDAVCAFDEGVQYQTVQIEGRPFFVIIFPYWL